MTNKRCAVSVDDSIVHHLDIALRLLTDIGTAGNLTTDVQLAAYAIEHNAEMHSNHTDFARFPDLTCVNPLQ